MKNSTFILGATLVLMACGEAHSLDRTSSAQSAQTQTQKVPSPSDADSKPDSEAEPPPAEAEAPLEDEKPIEIVSVDGQARMVALEAIAAGYTCILANLEGEGEKVASVTKAFDQFQTDSIAIIQSMEKLPAGSSKRRILLGQLTTNAARLYGEISLLHGMIPVTTANSEAILALVAAVDAFRKI